MNHEHKYDVSDAAFYVDVGFSSEALGAVEFSVLDSSEEPDRFILLRKRLCAWVLSADLASSLTSILKGVGCFF